MNGSPNNEHKEARCQRTRELDAQWQRSKEMDDRLRAIEVALAIIQTKVIFVAGAIGLCATQIPALLRFLGGG